MLKEAFFLNVPQLEARECFICQFNLYSVPSVKILLHSYILLDSFNRYVGYADYPKKGYFPCTFFYINCAFKRSLILTWPIVIRSILSCILNCYMQFFIILYRWIGKDNTDKKAALTFCNFGT